MDRQFQPLRCSYSDWKIILKEADGFHKWYFFHKELSGADDSRQGYAASLDQAKDEIDKHDETVGK